MDKYRLTVLADYLEKLPDYNGFTMLDWGRNLLKKAVQLDFPELPLGDRAEQAVDENVCGSAGCLNGWTVTLFGSERDQDLFANSMHNNLTDDGHVKIGANLLDLPFDVAKALFLPTFRIRMKDGYMRSAIELATRENAVAVVRALIDGEHPRDAWQRVLGVPEEEWV